MNKIFKVSIITFWLIAIAFISVAFCGNALAATDLGLRAAKGSLDDSVKLTWQKDPDPTVKMYQVLRDGTIMTPAVNGSDGQIMDPDITMLMDYRVAPDKQYTYVIQSYDGVSTTPISTSSITITKTATGVDDLGIGGTPRAGEIDFPESKYGSVADLITELIKWLFGFVGAFAVVALVYSGVTYATAGMDTEKAFKAQKNIVWAIIGVVVAASAFLIIQLIASATKPLT